MHEEGNVLDFAAQTASFRVGGWVYRVLRDVGREGSVGRVGGHDADLQWTIGR
jgi:hypothetical protein